MNRSIEQLIAQLREIVEHNIQHEQSSVDASVVLDVLETEIRSLRARPQTQASSEPDEGPITEANRLADLDAETNAACGPVSHDEARAILSRFVNSHFKNPGEHARVSIPADPRRDDDLRMAAYIAQCRARDAATTSNGQQP